MPLMMDDSITVDDLFGVSTTLELGLTSPSPSSVTKGLAQRIDELRLLGCCQKVAWSKLGCIACISQDGLRVNVRHLQCRPSDGKWVLSADTPLLPVTEAHGGNPLVHLSWNETGSELAIADSSGRVSIYSVSIALNSIQGLRQAIFDQEDDAAQIVGMMWLNSQRSVHAFHQAAKMNGRWAYSPFRRRPTPPFHPGNKPALLTLSRSGQLKLLYQNPDSRWAELSAELKNTGHSDRLLTHATMVATQNGILVATYSSCQKICLYRVQINWTQLDNSQPKPAPPSAQFQTPAFRLHHVKIESPGNFLGPNRNLGESSEDFPSFPSSVYCLTHLTIIQNPLDNPTGTATGPYMIAVYANPLCASPDHAGVHGSASVIVRWQLDTASQTLHPKFDEVASKKTSIQAKPKVELRRLEDVYSDKHVISVEVTEYGNVLAFTHDDGSVSFYDPKNMTTFNGVDDTNTVTSLAQVGFLYPIGIPGFHVAFSPNACIYAVLDGDWQMHLRVMEHSFGAEQGLYDDTKFSAAVASLTLAFCRGCGSDVNTDDILFLTLQQLSSEAQNTLISEIYRALPINCNFTAEQEKLLHHPYIPRSLSLQAALGFKTSSKPRDLVAAVPWAILNLRHASLLFVYFFQYNKGPQTEPHDAYVLRMVLGNTKWALDFSHYIMNEVFDLVDEFESVFNDQEAFTQKLKSTSSLALIILLSSMSRAFLRYICRGLRGVYAGFSNAVALSGDARVYYTEICQTLDASPVQIDVYEKFLAGVDSAVRHAYQGAGFGDAERPNPEKELLVNARIPPVLIPAVATLLKQTVPALKPEIDRMAIYLCDYSWLGFTDDRRTELYRKTRSVDVLKKIPLSVVPNPSCEGENGKMTTATPLPSPPRRRRCVRCCEISGDISTPRSLLSFRMVAKMGILRSCLCGGMWTFASGSGDPVDNS
ncbi:hypothetical protein ASPZODRAFT_89066 [Penicilliopsis zonata CBS 506.65]|uniref:Mediator of RNA polymerase II transcription subunit 16 n=1 Tax=Penicilliopsis zonata CBS 506.65 TaxID=1073090 RepID=A0A1L9SRA4_9EURO|nr:hypothetical protein ASPZODRAFT_89066 [Penicilliopsis zonata CBS 506.65]OJJ49688.1 hypothetical protein ASPZODRAFT_89066 [Penicilliopsis zonata CBS 506.65]